MDLTWQKDAVAGGDSEERVAGVQKGLCRRHSVFDRVPDPKHVAREREVLRKADPSTETNGIDSEVVVGTCCYIPRELPEVAMVGRRATICTDVTGPDRRETFLNSGAGTLLEEREETGLRIRATAGRLCQKLHSRKTAFE
jgi:hypothetical protein